MQLNRWFTYMVTLCLGQVIFVGQGYASLDSAQEIEQTMITDAQSSQKKVNQSADKALLLRAEIEALQAEIEGLEVYQKHLNNILLSQDTELESLQYQLVDIAQTRQDIVPLMYQMLDALEHYIQQDLPIRKAPREKRLAALRTLMIRADVSDAEKYRRILEAYQIEMDYVNKLGVFIGKATISGVEREVEQLNFGHLSFVARSLDKSHYWVWNSQSKQWLVVAADKHKDVDLAFKVANKQSPPSLIRLPLSKLLIQKEVNQ